MVNPTYIKWYCAKAPTEPLILKILHVSICHTQDLLQDVFQNIFKLNYYFLILSAVMMRFKDERSVYLKSFSNNFESAIQNVRLKAPLTEPLKQLEILSPWKHKSPAQRN